MRAEKLEINHSLHNTPQAKGKSFRWRHVIDTRSSSSYETQSGESFIHGEEKDKISRRNESESNISACPDAASRMWEFARQLTVTWDVLDVSKVC